MSGGVMEIEMVLLVALLIFGTMVIGIVALSIRNKDLEIEIARLKKQIELEALRGELNLAKFQIPKK
jgi:hypothetical protein